MTSTALLDSNIYDRLQEAPEIREAIAAAITAGVLRIIVTPKVCQELEPSPFQGVPGWFPVEHVVESVAVVGHWVLGFAVLGAGAVFTAHRGSSGQAADAIIADSADAYADILVSEDKRCRKHLADAGSACAVMSFDGFKTWLLGRCPTA